MTESPSKRAFDEDDREPSNALFIHFTVLPADVHDERITELSAHGADNKQEHELHAGSHKVKAQRSHRNPGPFPCQPINIRITSAAA
jgi:hypothetical protein